MFRVGDVVRVVGNSRYSMNAPYRHFSQGLQKRYIILRVFHPHGIKVLAATMTKHGKTSSWNYNLTASDLIWAFDTINEEDFL